MTAKKTPIDIDDRMNIGEFIDAIVQQIKALKLNDLILVTNDPSARSSKLKSVAKHGTKIISEVNLEKLLG